MDLRFGWSRRWYVVVVVALRSELFLATREGASQRGAYYCAAADSCAPAGQEESLLQVVQPQLHRSASSRSSEAPRVSELVEKAALGDVERSEVLWEPKRAAVVELEWKADVSASRRQERGGAGAHAVAGHLGPLWPIVGLVQAVGLIWQWCDSALPNVLHSYSAPKSDPYYSLPSSSPAGETAAAAAAAATPESPAWTALMLLATRAILQVVSIAATILMIWCAIPCFCSLLTRRKRREWEPAMWIPPDFVEDTLGENPVGETPSQLDIDVLALNSLYS